MTRRPLRPIKETGVFAATKPSNRSAEMFETLVGYAIFTLIYPFVWTYYKCKTLFCKINL
jgi:hypothetical protein